VSFMIRQAWSFSVSTVSEPVAWLFTVCHSCNLSDQKRPGCMLTRTLLRPQLEALEDIAAKHRAAVLDNARLYNEVQDLRGAIRVFCRVRPAGATGDGSPPCVEVGVDGQVLVGHMVLVLSKYTLHNFTISRSRL